MRPSRACSLFPPLLGNRLLSRGVSKQFTFTLTSVRLGLISANFQSSPPSSHTRSFTTFPPLLRVLAPKHKKTNTDMTTAATTLKGQPFDKAVLDSVLRRRMFYTPSYEVCPSPIIVPILCLHSLSPLPPPLHTFIPTCAAFATTRPHTAEH